MLILPELSEKLQVYFVSIAAAEPELGVVFVGDDELFEQPKKTTREKNGISHALSKRIEMVRY